MCSTAAASSYCFCTTSSLGDGGISLLNNVAISRTRAGKICIRSGRRQDREELTGGDGTTDVASSVVKRNRHGNVKRGEPRTVSRSKPCPEPEYRTEYDRELFQSHERASDLRRTNLCHVEWCEGAADTRRIAVTSTLNATTDLSAPTPTPPMARPIMRCARDCAVN